MAAETSTSTVVAKQGSDCIAVGWSGIIRKVDDSHVVKIQKEFSDDPQRTELYRRDIINEKDIYERLGDHTGIIQYYGIAYTKTGAIAVKLAYAKDGDLSTYIRVHDKPSEGFRRGWIRSLVETFYHIHCRKVLHQDIKTNNILVVDDCLKVVDFASGALYPLDTNMEYVYANDRLARVELLYLGCVIYSIATWKVFFYDYFEEEEYWPALEELPSTSGVLYEAAIEKCWGKEYGTIASLHKDLLHRDLHHAETDSFVSLED